jgi:hypothetical protein
MNTVKKYIDEYFGGSGSSIASIGAVGGGSTGMGSFSGSLGSIQSPGLGMSMGGS